MAETQGMFRVEETVPEPDAYTLDSATNALRLITLLGERGTITVTEVSDELNVDIAADGSVYGIELLNANEQLRAADQGKLVLVDEVAGKEVELPLSLG